MGLYTKKPVTIQAVYWDGNLDTLSVFPKEDTKNIELRDGALYIQTLEGEMRANIGDYIIRGIKGEYYPCRADIFEATYTKATYTKATDKLPEMVHLDNALYVLQDNDIIRKHLKVEGNRITVDIQNGTIPDAGVNGIQITDLLEYVKEVYVSLNDAYPCIENADTIQYITNALKRQADRTANREKRGVEGKHIA